MAKIKVSNDPKAEVSSKAATPKTPANASTDVRDILSMMAGGAHTSTADPEVKKAFLHLSGIVGQPTAQKLSTAAFLFNQRPEVQKMTPEQRVQGFFDLGSNDPEVAQHLKQGRGIGYGQLQGFRTSPFRSNMLLTGRASEPPATPPEATAEKIKLLVKNKLK